MQNQGRSENPQNFAFDRLGVRVPAIAISPWIPKGGLGSRAFPGRSFDHTSIVKTAMIMFGVRGSLGARVAAAPSLEGLCSLTDMRAVPDDVPTQLPPTAISAPVPQSMAATTAIMPESTTKAFSRVAMSLDLRVNAATDQPPVALAHPTFTETSMLTADPAATAVPDPILPRGLASARTNQQTLHYIQSVASRVGQAQPGSKRSSP